MPMHFLWWFLRVEYMLVSYHRILFLHIIGGIKPVHVQLKEGACQWVSPIYILTLDQFSVQLLTVH